MRNAKSIGNSLQTRKAEPAGVNATDGSGQPHKIKVLEHAEHGFVVSAKDLHQGLGVGRDFSSWLKSKIARFEFEAGVDYWEFEAGDLDSPKRGNQDESWGGDRKSQDYWLSLDMAKELAMLERSPAGRAARKYFLECERRLKEVMTQGLGAGASRRIEPEYRLTANEQELFNSYKTLFSPTAIQDSALYVALDYDLDHLILPSILRVVLEDAGLNDEATNKLELRGYGMLFMISKISARDALRAEDVAMRCRTGEISPRLVAKLKTQMIDIIAGRMSARQEQDSINKLESCGVFREP